MLNSTPAPSLTFTLYFISCLPTCSLMSRPEKQTERQTHLQAMGKESVAYFSGYTSYQHRSTLKPPTQYCACSPSAAKSDMTLRGMVTRLLGESFGSRIDVFPLHLPTWLYSVDNVAAWQGFAIPSQLSYLLEVVSYCSPIPAVLTKNNHLQSGPTNSTKTSFIFYNFFIIKAPSYLVI